MAEISRRKALRLQGYDYRQPGAYFFTTVIHNRENLLGQIRDTIFEPTIAGRIVLKTWQDLPKHYPHIVLDSFVIMPNHVHGIIFLEECSSVAGRGGSVEFNPNACEPSDPPLQLGDHFSSGAGRGGSVGFNPNAYQRSDPPVQLGDHFSSGAGRGGSVEFNPNACQPSDPPLPGKERHGLPEIIRAFKSFSARRINLMRGTPGEPVWQRNYYEHIIRDSRGLEQIQKYILGNVALWEQDELYHHD